MPETDEPLKLGLALLQKEKYLDALREFLKLEKEYSGRTDDDAASYYAAVSQCYYGMEPKTDENSKKYGLMALEIHKDLRDAAAVINDLVYLSYVEMDAGKSKDAEEYLDQALNISREVEDDQIYAEILTMKADLVSNSKRRRAEAGKLYANAAHISLQSEAWNNYFEAMCGVIRLKREESDVSELLKEASTLMSKAENVAASLKTKKARKAFADDVASVYDLASDLAMEDENVDLAMEIAKRLSKLAST